MKFIRINSWKGLVPIFNMLLFTIYPVLALYAYNVDQLVLKQLLFPIIISLVLSTILFGLWLLILKNYLQASLATVFLLVLSWNYGLLYMGITKIVSLKHWHLIPIFLFIYFHLVYFITKTRQQKTLNNLNAILFYPILLLIIINVITILPPEYRKFKTLRNNNYKVNRQAHEVTGSKYYPDIYLIILDEYASLKTIKEEWGYDNIEFAKFLREKGFFVTENSEARYNQTTWNLSSLFNLDYLTGPVDKNTFLNFIYEPGSIRGSEKYNMLMKIDFTESMQKENTNFLTNYLKEDGYKIIVLEGISQLYSSFNIHNTDIHFSYQNVNKSEYSSFLLDPFYLELIRKSILFPFDMFLKIDQTYNINYDGTKYVFNYLKTKVHYLKSPKFIYAHILCPHGPYVFDREGNYVSPITADNQRDGIYVAAKNTVNEAYLMQYIYVTNEVKNIVNSHINKKSTFGPVLIIQSDHGPRPHELYLKDRTNSFKVFNAIFFPDGDYKNLYDSISPVNTLRVVLNKYFRENFNMLEDK